MRFIDLDKIKIRKAEGYITREFDVVFPSYYIGLKDMKQILQTKMEEVFTERHNSGIEVYSIFNIIVEDKSADEEDTEEMFFNTVVNILLSAFTFANCIDGQGRKRERRLDAPEIFKNYCYINASLIKKMVNTATKFEVFNVAVKMASNEGDFNYEMVNQDYELDDTNKNVIDKDFIHDVDELGETNDN